jgi:hypothetical protein
VRREKTMKSKRHSIVSMLPVSLVILLGFSVTEGKTGDFDYGRIAELPPSNGRILGWIKDLWGLGDELGCLSGPRRRCTARLSVRFLVSSLGGIHA